MKLRFFGKAILGLAFAVALGWIVMALWNAVMPGLFDGVHPITYWRAVGLLLLSRILFGGFRGRRGRRDGRGRHNRWREWENLSPEERTQLMADRKAHWGGWCWGKRAETRREETRSGSSEG